MQVRTANHQFIVGTGFIVSFNGKIVTCAHVVREAGIDPYAIDGEPVGIYLPQMPDTQERQRQAVVVHNLFQNQDDIVVLKITGERSHFTEAQVAVLGYAELGTGNPFRSYGYRQLGMMQAGRADGVILGDIDPPSGETWLVDPIQVRSSEINRGMSGAAVLDVKQNLVVGVIYATWYPDDTTKDRDTGWAVNARILTLEPFFLPARAESLPLRQTTLPTPRVPPTTVSASEPWLYGAPPVLAEWVGREDLLRSLDADWANMHTRITGLIAFGGEGKSSLARHWLQRVMAAAAPPEAVFWWGFNSKPSVEEFLEAIIGRLAGPAWINRARSARARVEIVGNMLREGRYLFVLDGLEVLQYQPDREGDTRDEDRSSLLKSGLMKQFLEYFATPGHHSFCLITSRLPLLDFLDIPGYQHRDVSRLNMTEGCELLRLSGALGTDETLARIGSLWGWHALTLSLLGTLAAARFAGDVEAASHHFQERITVSPAREPTGAATAGIAMQMDHVGVILAEYDAYLEQDERLLAEILAAFRLPVPRLASEAIWRLERSANTENDEEDDTAVRALTAALKRLTAFRIINHTVDGDVYTVHPLIRNYYNRRLRQDAATAVRRHDLIAAYYLSLYRWRPTTTLDDFVPLIEAVYHRCQGGEFDRAFRIYWERIQQKRRFELTNGHGAWELNIQILRLLFPDGNLHEAPLVERTESRYQIYTELGLSALALGDLWVAGDFMRNAAGPAKALENSAGRRRHSFISQRYRNAATILGQRGQFDQAISYAKIALQRARKKNDWTGQLSAAALAGWLYHLTGNLAKARQMFRLAREKTKGGVLYGRRGVLYAEHLQRTGKSEQAQFLTEHNLKHSRDWNQEGAVTLCLKLLGELCGMLQDHTTAAQYFTEAFTALRNTQDASMQIELWLARGKWAAERGEVTPADADLNRAAAAAAEGGFKIYESEAHIGLAWAYFQDNDFNRAVVEARNGLRLSQTSGYYWGVKGAAELLALLDPTTDAASSA